MAATTPISDRAISEAVLDVSSPAPSSSLPSAARSDLWIFRDGKRAVSGSALVSSLQQRIAACTRDQSGVLDALIEAGALEAGLADAGSVAATIFANITDLLAEALYTGNPVPAAAAAEVLDVPDIPEMLSVSPPEGFTYYALHPSDFANVLSRIPEVPRHCAVIGVRSIGTTLSAVLLAALSAAGRPANRITVRPSGHPYSRRTEFSPDEMSGVRQNITAQFLVVDEGPGRSGSTFLSVAEALLREGVPRQNVTLIGSRDPDVTSLCADDVVMRWQAFRFIATSPSVNGRFQGWTYAGGGHWRHLLLPEGELWPESWTQMERLKFISPDGQSFYKFEGMGPIGAVVRDRAFALADAGFGPKARDAGDGFLAYELLRSPRLRPADISTALLNRMADYCAFRHTDFAIQNAQPTQLGEMLAFNVSQEFGVTLSLPEEILCMQRAVIVDGRMQPHEWIAGGTDNFVKTDGVDHGDNHFFPGPCDIAWDIAGIAVEWGLEESAVSYLIDRFCQLSGRNLFRSFSFYKLAYCVFRLGSCKMAISTVKGSPEEQRLTAAYSHYRGAANTLLTATNSALRIRAA
jgi:hypothetical protein